EGAGLEVPALAATTQEQLREIVPSAAVANPVDLLAPASAPQYARALDIALADPDVDAALAIFTPLRGSDSNAVVRALASAAERSRDKPLVAAVVTSEAERAALRARLSAEQPGQGRLPLFGFPESAVRAIGRAASHVEWRLRPRGKVATFASLDVAAARARIAAELAALPDGGWLGPVATAELLRCHGIELARSELVTTPSEAGAAAERLGFPVAPAAGGPRRARAHAR